MWWNQTQIYSWYSYYDRKSVGLPRTTERPVRERGDSPREIISSIETLKTALAPISRGECSEFSGRVVPQSLERKSVVRGLPRPHDQAARDFPFTSVPG
jgi:hypothetical protein